MEREIIVGQSAAIAGPARPTSSNLWEELSAEDLMTIGDVMSKSLLFALGRNYLDGPIFNANYVRLVDEDVPDVVEAAFLHLEQVGQPVVSQPGEHLRAIQTFLGAAHDPRYALLFIISSNGYQNHIYVGVVARAIGAHPKLFAEQLGQFLASNWPGTRVSLVGDYNNVVQDIHVPLSQYRYARVMTGLPSPKTAGPVHDMQSLDQFMRGLRGKPYLYMVIAEPMPERKVDEIIGACRTLSGQMHAFTKTTINRSATRGVSASSSRSASESTSQSSSHSSSRSASTSESESGAKRKLDKLGGVGKAAVGVGASGVALAASLATGGFGGAFLLNGMVGMMSQLSPSMSTSESTGESSSYSESASQSSSISETEGTTTGESLSMGREYLNKHAEACEKLLEQTVQRFEIARGQGCWNVGVYLLSNQAEAAAQAQAQLKALVSGEKSSSEPIRLHDLQPVWDGRAQVALDAFQQPPLKLFSPTQDDRLNHPLGEVFESLTTPLNTEELSLLANLPMREMPGLPVQSTAYFSLNPPQPKDPHQALQFGHILDGGEQVGDLTYAVDLNALTRHIFITGITGSGKSNTCRRLIAELMKQGVNFMVIEPAKDEYVELALAYNEAGTFDREIAVYVPGRKDWRGTPLEQLRLNPFDQVMLPGVEPQVMAHMDRLKSIFNSAFAMQEILPVILEEGLVDLYESQGWLEETLPPADVGRPTLEQLHSRIPALVRAKGYDQKITDNIVAALKTRLSSLLRGWKGELFNHALSTPWPELFDRPVVINLGQMGDDADKCFTMGLLLNFLYEYRQAQHAGEGAPESGDLRHLMIIEEAHRVLRHMPPGNPQGKMGEIFADMLAEIRSYGQGFGIIDQVPAKLVPDALKNTNLKIIHRLVAGDDRQTMAGTLGLTPEQTQIIARLKVGQAIVCGVQDDMASWVQIFYTPLR
ncbi:MAG: ATP-binding protein [Anaerolineae bacterium]|nr:ATP-binding protein [Anaerolineae bacterium]